MGIRKILRARNDEGTMAILMIVVLVATGLVMITAATVEQGLRTSRRGGDAANALQVADAGVNDAISAISTAGGGTFTRSGTVGNGSYSYTATQDAANPAAWLIDVYGTDQTGVKRHVRAMASGLPLFASPMYVNTAFSTKAGAILDSFRSGVSLAGPSGNYTDGGCTDHGVLFFNPDAQITFPSTNGGGTSINNCNQLRFGTWKYSMDGCVMYGGVFNIPSTAWGTAKCPSPTDATFPNRTKSIPDTFSPTPVEAPKRSVDVQSPTQSSCAAGVCAPTAGSSLTCNGTTLLKLGWTYYYDKITLAKDCAIDPTTVPATATPDYIAAHPVLLFTKALNVTTGTHGEINAPPISGHSTLCGSSTSTWTYQDVNNNPAWNYCSGWVRSLSINMIGESSTVNITGNNGKFWGTFNAPGASVTLDAPQIEFWGAMLAKNLDTATQFSWHYDDSLSSQTTGKYTVNNWREEPL
jgi:hypothetical protein